MLRSLGLGCGGYFVCCENETVLGLFQGDLLWAGCFFWVLASLALSELACIKILLVKVKDCRLTLPRGQKAKEGDSPSWAPSAFACSCFWLLPPLSLLNLAIISAKFLCVSGFLSLLSSAPYSSCRMKQNYMATAMAHPSFSLASYHAYAQFVSRGRR